MTTMMSAVSYVTFPKIKTKETISFNYQSWKKTLRISRQHNSLLWANLIHLDFDPSLLYYHFLNDDLIFFV